MNFGRRMVAMLAVLAMANFGCATAGSGSGERTALDRSVQQCIASIALGTILGAVVGASHHKAGQGAAIGAGVGGAACIVILAVNNANDKARIRKAQHDALEANADHTDQYVGSDGKERTIKTTVSDWPDRSLSPTTTQFSAATTPRLCRRTQTEITVQGSGTASIPAEIVCRTDQGDWVPYNQGSTT